MTNKERKEITLYTLLLLIGIILSFSACNSKDTYTLDEQVKDLQAMKADGCIDKELGFLSTDYCCEKYINNNLN